MDIGSRIKTLRLENNLTQDELAQKLGLKKAAIHKYENGLVENIKRSVIKKMADIFQVSPCYLLGWEDSTSNKSKSSNLKDDETTLLSNYNKLNDIGKKEASKRVAELTQINIYIKDNSQSKKLTYADFDTVAAHNDNLTPDEISEADRRILADINKRK